MKTKRTHKNRRKTLKGGNHPEIRIKQLIQDILNYAIKFRLRSEQDKIGTQNPEVYYRMLLSSKHHRELVKNLANYVLKKINKDPNWTNIWNDTDRSHRSRTLIQIILSYAGLYYGGLTNPGEDFGDFMTDFGDDMEEIDNRLNNIMVYYILYQSGIRSKIDDIWALNKHENLNKIKALTHKVPQIGDAETMEMLTSHFENEKPDYAGVYPFSPGVKPFMLKPDA